jgi:hypothetical protein
LLRLHAIPAFGVVLERDLHPVTALVFFVGNLIEQGQTQSAYRQAKKEWMNECVAFFL